jgi:hypothetical protein
MHYFPEMCDMKLRASSGARTGGFADGRRKVLLKGEQDFKRRRLEWKELNHNIVITYRM